MIGGPFQQYGSGLCCTLKALRKGHPQIFNTDQAANLRATGTLLKAAYASAWTAAAGPDNVFIERLWRTVKYEDVYLKDYADGQSLYAGLKRYFHFYNHERPHSALDNRTPASCHGYN